MTGCNVTFLMGKFEAAFPDDRRYCRNHMWAMPVGGRVRFGFTAYSVRLLQDVYFLDWNFAAAAPVAERDAIGRIESSKAESELYAPAGGVIVEFNPALLHDPSAINRDAYGDGWLFEMEADASAGMTAQEYAAFLDVEWKKAERYLKGQVQ